MKRHTASAAVGLMFIGAVIYASVRLGSIGEQETEPAVPSDETKHLVTSRMAKASQGMVQRSAPDFREDASDGHNYALAELTRQGPVLLTFIKIGCPCSQAAQPYFNQLAATYPGVRILGVIDGELGPAGVWLRQIRTGYPALLDPDLKLVRAYAVGNSAYVVLIDRGGRIVNHWPGYSSSMLQQLGATLASLTASPLRPIDTRDAPAELYTGCPYAL